jgi:hypothetical protein
MSEVIDELKQLQNVTFEVRNLVSTNYYSNAGGFLKFKNSPDYLSNDINNAIDAVGASIYVINSNYQIRYATNLFYLTGFSFALKERAQVTNSLKEPIIAFFDESVKVYTFQGVAPDAGTTDSVNTSRNFHHSSLVHLYNNHLRGTELAKNKNIAVLKVGNHTVYGYPLNLNSSFNSSQDKVATFNMNWAVAKHTLDLPGIVTNQNLEDMTSVVNFNEQDIFALIEYLNRYVQEYNFVLNQSDAYLSNVFELEALTDLAQNVVDLQADLIIRGVLNPYELFILELSRSVEEVKSAQSAKSWIKYRTKATSALETIKQYLKDIQEGRGRVNDGFTVAPGDTNEFEGTQLKESLDYLNSLPKLSQYTKY